MESGFSQHLTDRLKEAHKNGLHRSLRELQSPQGVRITVDGRTLTNFSSNDYLGLAAHPEVVRAATTAIDAAGAGLGASRLISGNHQLATKLESKIAHLKGTTDTIFFSTGYAAAVGTIPAIAGKNDIVILDRLAHASLVDGARLSNAKLRVFRHNDLADLERILKWSVTRPGTATNRSRILIITESVFSMDGDLAPLEVLVELKDRYGAWLMVDEAHGTGVFGKSREGLIGQLGLTNRVELQMGTLGKALGSAGGFVAGSAPLRDFLINNARSLIFSTAPVPAQIGAAIAAVEIIISDVGQQLHHLLWENVSYLGKLLTNHHLINAHPTSPIIPILIGDETLAVRAAERASHEGFWVPAIRFPSVGKGKARLRITVSASHSKADIDGLVDALAHAGLNQSACQ